jgi:hypothetical protein
VRKSVATNRGGPDILVPRTPWERFVADSALEGEGFEPPVPRKRDNALRDWPFRFLGTLLDQPTFRSETCATLETARRLGRRDDCQLYARHSFSGMLVDKEGRRCMLSCSRSASWGTFD